MADLLSILSGFWDTIVSLFAGDDLFFNILDILIVAFIIYQVILLVRKTRAMQLAVGVLFVLVVFVITVLLKMRTLQYLLSAVLNIGTVFLVVIFQPELRRALEQVGGVNSVLVRLFRSGSVEGNMRSQWEKAIVAVCDAAEKMAEEKTGALLVLERYTNLSEIVRTGTQLHSDVNIEVLTTIFYESSPLHDGAVILRDGRVEAAGCFLPLSNNIDISKDMGTRHRAALGMSENSDAIVVVVSEETGTISLAQNAVLIRRLDRQNLFNLLVSEVIPPQPAADKKENWFRRVLQEVRNGKEK